MCSELDRKMKMKYAMEIVLNKGDAYKAAVAIIGPNDTNTAFRLFCGWKDDAMVLAEVARIKKEQPELGTPTKTEVLEELWRIGTNPQVREKERIEALKQYSLIKGYMAPEDKKEMAIPSVMVVPGYGMDTWEQAAINQQRSSCGIKTEGRAVYRGN